MMRHSIKVAAILLLNTVLVFQAKPQQTIPGFPPNDVDNALDFHQMLHQMGIKLPDLPARKDDPNLPKGAVPTNPQRPEGSYAYNGHNLNRSAWGLWDNYDDSAEGFFPGQEAFRTGDYTPIPLLAMKNGEKITSAKDWWGKRRPEIAYDVQKSLYGFFPDKDKMPGVDFKVVETTGGMGNGKYIQKELTGVIDVSGYPEVRNKPVITATLRTPVSATGPVPVMIVIGGFGNTIDRYWDIVLPHGWGICTFSPNTVQPDNGAGLTSYLVGLVNKGNWRKPDDWGAIGAWAWGISRLMDYLQADKAVNGKAIGLTGHSRYGKATLFAAAFDSRIAIAFPSDAGSLGTKMNRRHWGQDLENSGTPSEYHWMAGNFLQWCGELVPGQYLPRKVANCPVDAHSLVALCAPRPVFVNGGNQSQWSDPYGMYLTVRDATPVYELLGKKGLVMKDDKPRIDAGYIEGTLGYRYHDGGHTDAPDWPAFFDFSARFIDATELNIPVEVLSLPVDGKAKNLAIKSNRKWKISNSASWLILDKKSGAKDGSISLSAKNNTTGSGRSTELVIEAEGRKLILLVTQASANAKIDVSKTALTLTGSEMASELLEITSGTAWDIADTIPWIQVDKIAGINNGQLRITALPNPFVQERTAVLTVSSSTETKSIKVTQQEGLPVLRITGNPSVKAESSGGNASVYVTTNTDCSVESPADWVSGRINRQGMFSSLVLQIKENTTGKPRSAKVTLKVKGLDPAFVEVTQE